MTTVGDGFLSFWGITVRFSVFRYRSGILSREAAFRLSIDLSLCGIRQAGQFFPVLPEEVALVHFELRAAPAARDLGRHMDEPVHKGAVFLPFEPVLLSAQHHRDIVGQYR